MKMRLTDSKHTYDPVIVRWETQAAKFLQIELSPSHIFRIRMDKDVNGKGGVI